MFLTFKGRRTARSAKSSLPKHVVRALGTTLCSIYLGSCGGTTHFRRPTRTVPSTTRSTTPRELGVHTAAQSQGYLKNDGDRDAHGPRVATDEDDRGLFTEYPVVVSGNSRNAAAAVVASFYRALSTGDNQTVCALLSPVLASGLTRAESKPGRTPIGCASSLASVLSGLHTRALQESAANVTVWSVRARGNAGIALIGFPRAPEMSISLEREGRRWRMAAINDSEIP